MKTQRIFGRLLSVFFLVAVGCGGGAKPAETAGANGGDSPSSNPSGDKDSDSREAGSKSGSDPASTQGGDDASSGSSSKKDDGAGTAGDKATIASGLQLLDHRSLTLDFDLNLMKKGEGKGVQSGSWSFAEERTMRVRTAKKDIVSELQVVYGKWEAKPLLGLTYEMPTDGKTYLIVSDGSNLKITRGANETVTAGDEQRAVKAEYGWVGDRSPLRKALLASKLAPGSDLGKSQELAQLILGEIPGANSNQSELSATLEKVESGARKKAILKIDARAKLSSNKTVFELDLHGTAAVDIATGWVVAVDLSGVTQANGTIKHPKQGELEVSGKGKVTLTRKGDFK